MKNAKRKRKNEVGQDGVRVPEDKALERVSPDLNLIDGYVSKTDGYDARYPHMTEKRADKKAVRHSLNAAFTPQFAHEVPPDAEEPPNIPKPIDEEQKRVDAILALASAHASAEYGYNVDIMPDMPTQTLDDATEELDIDTSNLFPTFTPGMRNLEVGARDYSKHSTSIGDTGIRKNEELPRMPVLEPEEKKIVVPDYVKRQGKEVVRDYLKKRKEMLGN